MNDATNKDLLDLGSDPSDDFDPFASDGDLGEEDEPAKQEPEQEKASEPKKSKAPKSAETSGNPLESAINAAETKDAEKAQQGLFEKQPVFVYAGAKEEIDDTSKTFDELRIEKSTDFPELDDGKRVSWTVEYGKITKHVSDPKGMSIGKMKADIETSKEFVDALKKAKDKTPDCKVTPKVTAQSKGVMSSYKGVFTNIEDVRAACKVTSILPARDGKVYEIRKTEMGEFTTPVVGCEMLSQVRAGFIPALPRIPKEMLMQVVAFFRYFTRHGADNEALLNIYWDKQTKEFIVDAPRQIVSKASVSSHISDDFEDDRYIHYMDIHSHNTMRAFFSLIDDADEKATRLYTVIGELHKNLPDIKTRISNGGKFLEIDPLEVFEPIDGPFPDEWKEKVRFRAPHGDDDGCKYDKDEPPWHTGGDGGEYEICT